MIDLIKVCKNNRIDQIVDCGQMIYSAFIVGQLTESTNIVSYMPLYLEYIGDKSKYIKYN